MKSEDLNTKSLLPPSTRPAKRGRISILQFSIFILQSSLLFLPARAQDRDFRFNEEQQVIEAAQ
ncbi:MAG TPA: hypothetical protein VK465_18275, partial [Fibrobacteria bacterium]|nr:hypothetical protein [Fibrobacteria bacterium]